MTAPNGDIAARYWREAIYDPATTLLRDIDARNMKEGSANEPLKFKPYRGVHRVALPDPALSLSASPRATSTALDAATVSTLLYYSYGVDRQDFQPGAWPYHRFVPSARCLFPTELYLVLPESGEGLHAGVYYYDPMHHTLVNLRSGDYRPYVERAAGVDLFGARGIVVLTSLFWKTAFRYRDYAYRLCSQESGMVAGNVEAVAGTLGLRAQFRHLFVDEMVNGLLGLDIPSENAHIVLPLYSASDEPIVTGPSSPPHSEGPAPPLGSLNSFYVQTSTFDGAGLEILSETSRASFLTEAGLASLLTEGVRPPAAARGNEQAGDIRSTSDADADGDGTDLAALLRGRDSGPTFMDFEAIEVSAGVVSRIARAITRPDHSDVATEDDRFACEGYLIVRRVADVAEGIYHVQGDATLDSLAIGPVSDALRSIAAGPGGRAVSSVNFTESALTVFLACRHRAAIDRFGARSFRILNQAAGIVAQRVCLASAAAGLSARVHNGYLAQVAERVFGLTAGESAILFQIAIGVSRPGSALRLPVAF